MAVVRAAWAARAACAPHAGACCTLRQRLAVAPVGGPSRRAFSGHRVLALSVLLRPAGGGGGGGGGRAAAAGGRAPLLFGVLGSFLLASSRSGAWRACPAGAADR